MTREQHNGRVALYLRVSTEEQFKHGLSLDFQELTCRGAAVKAGASSVEVFREEGYSGTTLKRPALAALRGRIGEFSCVYVWKLDRLSRPVKGFADLMQEFSDAGTGFVSVTEAVDYSGSAGRLMMNMLAAVAAFFADLNKERVQAALKHRTEAKRLHHGTPAFGYRITSHDQPIEPDPQTAPVVKAIFRRYASGQSMGEIVRWLNGAEIPPMRAKAWTYTSLRRVLENRVYIGEVWHRADGSPRSSNAKKTMGKWLPGLHQAILRKQDFVKVDARLKANKDMRPRARLASLTPLLHCGVCGGPVSYSGGSRASTGLPSYNCGNRRTLPQELRHDSVAATARKVDAAIWAYVEWWLGAGDWREALAKVRAKTAAQGTSDTAEEWRGRLAEIDAELTRWGRAFALGTLPEELFLRETEPIKREWEDLQCQLQFLPVGQDYRDRLALLEGQSVSNALELLRRKPADQQVIFLRTLFSKVELMPGRRLVFHPAIDALEPYTMQLPKWYKPGQTVFPMPEEGHGVC